MEDLIILAQFIVAIIFLIFKDKNPKDERILKQIHRKNTK